MAGRRWNAIGLALIATAVTVSCAPAQDGASAPDLGGANLLILSIDTLRADRVGAYGDKKAATPAIDALAARGVRFANSYASVPLTLPSHASMFTGHYPFELQVRTNGSYYLRAEASTLAERLRDHGYRTAAFVSSYVLASKFGLDQGFDHYDDRIEADDPILSLSSQVPADRVVDRFVEWLRDSRDPSDASQRPYLAWLHFYDPHLPYTPPELFGSRFPGDPYRGEIAFVDSQIARALSAARESPSARPTLIVVVSDHGESFGEHGEIGHGILAYEECLRVPFILAAPGLPAGAKIDSRARLLDLTPTLLDLLGLPPIPGASGRSLVPAIEGGNRDDRNVYFESLLGAEDYNWAPITGLIEGPYKYVSLPQPELYQLENDPDERDNLVRDRPEVAEQLDRSLQRLLLGAEPDTGPSRELTREDRARLEALGYLGQAEPTAKVIDPKQGIRLDAEMKRMRRLLEAGDLDSAAAGATELAAKHGDLHMPGLYALRHEIAARRGDAASAVAVLEEGLEALPDSPRLLFLLAHYLERAGRLEEAESASRRLLEAEPKNSQAYILLGRIAEARGRFAESVDSYGRALANEPLNDALRIRHAEALLRSGDNAAALAALDRLADEGALDATPRMLYQVAMLNFQAGATSRGETLFRRGLERAPGGVHHLTFGLLLLRNGKSDQAAGHLTTALEKHAGELSPEQLDIAQRTMAQLAAGTPTP